MTATTTSYGSGAFDREAQRVAHSRHQPHPGKLPGAPAHHSLIRSWSTEATRRGSTEAINYRFHVHEFPREFTPLRGMPPSLAALPETELKKRLERRGLSSEGAVGDILSRLQANSESFEIVIDSRECLQRLVTVVLHHFSLADDRAFALTTGYVFLSGGCFDPFYPGISGFVEGILALGCLPYLQGARLVLDYGEQYLATLTLVHIFKGKLLKEEEFSVQTKALGGKQSVRAVISSSLTPPPPQNPPCAFAPILFDGSPNVHEAPDVKARTTTKTFQQHQRFSHTTQQPPSHPFSRRERDSEGSSGDASQNQNPREQSGGEEDENQTVRNIPLGSTDQNDLNLNETTENHPENAPSSLLSSTSLRAWSSTVMMGGTATNFLFKVTQGDEAVELPYKVRYMRKPELEALAYRRGLDTRGPRAILINRLQTQKPGYYLEIDSRECIQRLVTSILFEQRRRTGEDLDDTHIFSLHFLSASTYPHKRKRSLSGCAFDPHSEGFGPDAEGTFPIGSLGLTPGCRLQLDYDGGYLVTLLLSSIHPTSLIAEAEYPNACGRHVCRSRPVGGDGKLPVPLHLALKEANAPLLSSPLLEKSPEHHWDVTSFQGEENGGQLRRGQRRSFPFGKNSDGSSSDESPIHPPQQCV